MDVKKRIVAGALLGMTVGAAATVVLTTNQAVRDIDNSGTAVAPPGTTMGTRIIAVEPLIRGEFGVEGRANLFEVIDRADIFTLTSMVTQATRLPQSPKRTFLLSALISRLAEQDPGEALIVLSQNFLDPRTSREVGLLLLDSLTPGLESIDSVIVALPQIDQRRFRAEALARLATTAPEQAIELALEITDEDLRTEALDGVVGIWMQQGPLAALAYAESISDSSQRFTFESAVLTDLALIDRGSMLAYLDDQYGDSAAQRDNLMRVITRAVAREDPTGSLELMEQLSENSRRRVEVPVGAALARLDPVAAMAYAEKLPTGLQSRRLRTTLATWSAEVAPDAALDWIRSLNPMPADLAAAVLEGVARVDPMRAIDLGEELSIVGSLKDVDSLQVSAPQIADRVLAIQDPAQREEWLRTLVGSWTWVDRDAALNWLIANSESVSSDHYQRIAQQMGREDPTAAIEFSGQLPADLQDDWVRSVVTGFVRNDRVGAFDWISQFRGQSVYDAGAAAVVVAVGGTNPDGAAALFRTLSETKQADVARQLGRSWARQSMPTARDWVTGLPSGPVRDTALSGIVEAYWDRAPDDALLSLFSSDSTRQEALVDAVTRIGQRDQAEARRLIDEYLSDPVLRQQAEHLLLNAGR